MNTEKRKGIDDDNYPQAFTKCPFIIFIISTQGPLSLNILR